MTPKNAFSASRPATNATARNTGPSRARSSGYAASTAARVRVVDRAGAAPAAGGEPHLPAAVRERRLGPHSGSFSERCAANSSTTTASGVSENHQKTSAVVVQRTHGERARAHVGRHETDRHQREAPLPVPHEPGDGRERDQHERPRRRRRRPRARRRPSRAAAASRGARPPARSAPSALARAARRRAPGTPARSPPRWRARDRPWAARTRPAAGALETPRQAAKLDSASVNTTRES